MASCPAPREREKFVYDITHHSMVHEQLGSFYSGFRRDAHPMAVMCGVVGGLSAFYHDSTDITDARQRMVATLSPDRQDADHRGDGLQVFHRPAVHVSGNNLGFAENFLHMMFATPCEDYEVNPVLGRAMDRILTLHADHEQNASTSTVRLAGSSDANPFACIAAGIASLWGPAHGGANEAVLKMLGQIGDKKNIPEFIKNVKDKKARLMGFGHRVYKNYDPRAKVWNAPATRCWTSSACTTSRCWRWRSNSSRSPSATPISSSASCTRTSISIRASSSAPWAFRYRCSRRCSRWRARWAG